MMKDERGRYLPSPAEIARMKALIRAENDAKLLDREKREPHYGKFSPSIVRIVDPVDEAQQP